MHWEATSALLDRRASHVPPYPREDPTNTLKDDLSFSFEPGAVALVTGGSRGIGRAIVLRLAAAGFDIWLNYQSRDEDAYSVRQQVLGKGRNCTLLKFDVADPLAVESVLIPKLENQSPSVLINNAGITCDGVMVFMGFDEWKRVLDVTLNGFFLVTKSVLQGMLLRRSGRIVNISSTSGETGRPGQVNYSAAKAGLIGATRSLAAEVARRGVLVNAVTPGLIETEMTESVTREDVLSAIPLRRFGVADDVSGVVSFLCSDQASYITGQVIRCNGGLYM